MNRGMALVAASILLLVACGDGGEQGEREQGEQADDDLLMTDLDGVQSAVVRIEAEGTFVDPEVGLQQNVAGSGSGFIIDPSGLVVTNNHVVTGAALLRVHVDGEDRPRNARVLGNSECSDLAVIDLDGEEYPYLAWYEAEVRPGLDVYTAGYPLGDPEYTLTRGIVSKARADGDTDWASVDSVVEHDATINPGNSGGPLVTAEAEVVGVNYAGDAEANQYFAISAAEAIPLLDRLRAGENINSIGVNGQAVSDGEDLNGIWVAAVASGSPADEVGVEPGDIITHLEGLELATDGTMADFCDILRSRDATAVMSLEVLRFETEQLLAGQLNGDPLEETFSFAEELAGEVDLGPESGTLQYADYTTITDDTGSISLDVPAEWADMDGTPFTHDGNQMFDVRASTDLESFANSWDTPGVIVTASQDLARTQDALGLLDILSEGFDQSCTHVGRFPYEDPLYTGHYDLFSECGGVGAVYVVVSAVPADGTALIGVQVQANDDRDFDALDRVLSTFVFTPQS